MTTTTEVRDRQTTMDLIHEFLTYANDILLPAEAAQHGYANDRRLELEGGRKFIKVSMNIASGGRSVHCFIGCADGIWGDVYMPAGWDKPALNGARYNLFDLESRELMYSRFDFAGGYLYKR